MGVLRGRGGENAGQTNLQAAGMLRRRFEFESGQAESCQRPEICRRGQAAEGKVQFAGGAGALAGCRFKHPFFALAPQPVGGG